MQDNRMNTIGDTSRRQMAQYTPRLLRSSATNFEQGKDDEMGGTNESDEQDSPMSNEIDNEPYINIFGQSLGVEEDDENGRLQDTRGTKRKGGPGENAGIYAKYGITSDTYANMPLSNSTTTTNKKSKKRLSKEQLTDLRRSDRIASLKGRTARSVSPTKNTPTFSNFGQQPQQPQQGFSFAQSGENTFGQSQPSNGGFTFGQQSAANSFTFGQSTSGSQAGAGTSFNFGSQSASFPQSGSSSSFQFGASQGAQPAQSPMAFQGSIFNTGAAAPSQQSPINGFGSPASANTPTPSAMPSALTEEERKEVTERERWMTTEQMKKLEELVAPSLATGTGEDAINHIENMPATKQRKILDYVRSLPSNEKSQQPALLSIFGQGCRALTTKGWVYEQDRAEIRSKLGKLSPQQQNEVVEQIKFQCYPLRVGQQSSTAEIIPNIGDSGAKRMSFPMWRACHQTRSTTC